MYTGSRMIEPDLDSGIDFSKEYEEAEKLFQVTCEFDRQDAVISKIGDAYDVRKPLIGGTDMADV